MAVHLAKTDALTVQAPNGVVWTQKPGGRSSASDLLRELADLVKDHIEREWDWWEEGRRDKEHERQWAVLAEWDNGAKDPPGFDPDAAAKACMEDFDRRMEEQRRERKALAAERYDKERESMRLRMLAVEADAAFFGHVLERQPPQCSGTRPSSVWSNNARSPSRCASSSGTQRTLSTATASSLHSAAR